MRGKLRVSNSTVMTYAAQAKMIDYVRAVFTKPTCSMTDSVLNVFRITGVREWENSWRRHSKRNMHPIKHTPG